MTTMRSPLLWFLLCTIISVQLINGSSDKALSDSTPVEANTLPSKYASRRVFTEAPATTTIKTTTTTTTSTTPASTSSDGSSNETVRITTKAPLKKRKLYSRANAATTTTKAPLSTVSPSSSSTTTSTTTVEPTTAVVFSATLGPDLNCGQRNESLNIHPWIVILEHTDPLNSTRRRTFSKGVLVSDKYVLTTVSSIHNSHPFWEVSRVRLGDFPVGRYKKISSYHPVFVNVEEIVLHPKRDIALVKLEKSVNFTELIQPICLPTNMNYNFRELILHVCHRNSLHSPSRVVVESQSVLPVSPQDCSTMYHRKGVNFNTREEFCSWDERLDTCTGDLGAPLIGKVDDRFHVIGLSSFATARATIQDDALPGVYTRVGRHLSWIQKVLHDNL